MAIAESSKIVTRALSENVLEAVFKIKISTYAGSGGEDLEDLIEPSFSTVTGMVGWASLDDNEFIPVFNPADHQLRFFEIGDGSDAAGDLGEWIIRIVGY